jgi:ABC-type sugar transport system substrate-binding protein
MKTHPLRFIALLALFFLASAVARAADEKYTFVLVHGATAGGWEWKSTGNYLLQDGHTADAHQ